MMQALFDLEATNQELKADLRDLYITGAKEIDVGSSRKAIIIHVRLQGTVAMRYVDDYLLQVQTVTAVIADFTALFSKVRLQVDMLIAVGLPVGAFPPAEGLPQDPVSPRA